MLGEEKIRSAMARLGLTFDLFKSVGEYVAGVGAYAEWSARRKRESASKMGRNHADAYRALSPEQKAAVLQQRFPRTVRTKIEVAMTNALDMDNPLFDATEGRTIYKILIKADYPDMSRNGSARRVATKVMLLGLVG